MAAASATYQHQGIVVVRASTDPGDLDIPGQLDVNDPAVCERDGRGWLAKLWSRDEVREALRLASPELGLRLDQLVEVAGRPVLTRDVRRAVLSTAAYLLRWQRRATPFGMFAGVATAAVGPAAATVGRRHRPVARADADWLAALVDQLERHRCVRRRLTVTADSAGVVRDGRFHVPGRAQAGAAGPGPLREVSVRHTRAVQAALAAASAPARFDALAAHLADRFPAVSPDTIDVMLHGLVDHGMLITGLRAPMTSVDGLAHLIAALHEAGADQMPDVAVLLRQLDTIADMLGRHNRGADPRQAAQLRASVGPRMTALAAGTGQVLAVDVALDGQITVPEPVLREAARAACVLLRLTTKPFGTASWLDYHAAFRARYGPGALVPVRELVADSGLGLPGGYLGAPRARPAWRMLTDRDAALLAMVQRAALDRVWEVTLTDADIEALTVGEHADIVAPARVELGVMLHATSTAAIDRGDFELRVTAAPRAYTSMAGRFAYLFGDVDRARLAASYTTGAHPDRGGGNHKVDPLAVQLSFPPRRRHNENVVRAPQLLPEVVSLSEHPAGGVIAVDDLAVTADADQMYLVQRCTGRRVEPRVLHALDATVQTPPLARFLAEVANARSAVFGPFDFGAARTLPYTPRIRYRRTVLSPARWILTGADLPADAPGGGWEQAFHAWRQRWRVPDRVVACHGELRLPLDLDQPLERALLRSRLARTGRLELYEDAPPQGNGWIGRPAELLIPLTTVAPASRRPPVTAPPGDLEPAGYSPVVCARLAGNPARFDDLLTGHLPTLAGTLAGLGLRRWWVRRHRDLIRPETEQHLAVFLRLATPEAYAPVAARLAELAADLHARGLPADLTLAPYRPHPGRYGQQEALPAAEHVFATDTQAAIAQIAMARAAGIPAQALAAASMTRLAAAFAPDPPPTGYRALLRCLPRHTGALDRSLGDLARHLCDPAGDYHAVRGLPGGGQVAAAWRARDAALGAYHLALAAQRNPAGVLRTLLHEHQVRALDVDPDFEQTTCRLARAAALRRLAPAGDR